MHFLQTLKHTPALLPHRFDAPSARRRRSSAACPSGDPSNSGVAKVFGRDVGVQLSLRSPVKPSAGSLVALKARTLRGAAVVIRAVRDIEMIIRPTLTDLRIVDPIA